MFASCNAPSQIDTTVTVTATLLEHALSPLAHLQHQALHVQSRAAPTTTPRSPSNIHQPQPPAILPAPALAQTQSLFITIASPPPPHHIAISKPSHHLILHRISPLIPAPAQESADKPEQCTRTRPLTYATGAHDSWTRGGRSDGMRSELV